MIIIVLGGSALLPAFTITSKRGQIVPKNERNDAENESTCAEKRENDAKNERKRIAYEKRKCYVLK